MRYFLVIFALLMISPFIYAQKSDKFTLSTIVIDAGHGGSDAGAVFGKLYEKDIVLDVALKFGKKINNAFPAIKVVYTRDKDVFIPLAERGIIANRAKGDFFISIHVNSTKDKNTQATGTETFTLGLHKSAANLEVAMKENSVITLEDDYKKKYEGFDPDDAESYIMFGLGQYGFNVSSISFADMLEDNYTKNSNGFKSRGIKQAGFLVLWRTSMPSVLTELGFINNANDRKALSSESGRDCVAESLFRSFKAYKEQVEVESHYTSNGGANVKNMKTEVAPKKEVVMSAYDEKGSAYAIQLMTSEKRITISKSAFGNYYKNVFEIKTGKKYKYLVGVIKSYNDALSLRSEISRVKFKDCFVVGVKRGKIVPHSDIKN